MIAEFLDSLLSHGYLQNALITSVIVGVACGIVGSFIVLRGMALIGDAISHAVLPGVAASYLLGTNLFLGAVVAGLLATLAIGLIGERSTVKNDSAIGIVFSTFFAIGVLLMAKAQTATDLTEILFGNVLTVQDADRNLSIGIAAAVLILTLVFYKELKLSTFDPVMAQSAGVPVRAIHYGLMVVLTLVTVISLQTVGVILVVSLLITPASAAYLLTNRLGVMIGLSVALSALSSVVGLFLSYSYNVSSGVTIVLTASALFLLAFLFAPGKGLIARSLGNKPLAALLALLVGGALVFGAVTFSTEEKADGEQLNVVTTFTLLADLVEEIGGEAVDVHNLVPTGTDPHDYDPLPADLDATSDADLLFYNGLNLEGGEHGWLAKLKNTAGLDDSQMVEATKGVEPKYLKDEKGNQEINPHAFLDPTVGIAMAENVTAALAEALPERAEHIEEKGAEYKAMLESIDADYREQIGALPKEDRVLVASEHAFQYMVDTYGMEQLYIWQIDTDENGSPAQIGHLVRQLKDKRPKHLFVESNVDTRPMKTVSKEAGIPIFDEPLHSDELGKPGTVAGTYEDFLRSNLKTMIAGLKR
ncbi:metal ABC transporter permease [Corynebacterium sp. c8Ua_181]|uniref:Metal ABC transporter permease n=1 Tax=Corynebacterium curieae TaxID=2913500 RepID=A0A9X3M9M1_9CORY|nr:metal ABC transporter permease [Corynebacterium curieae]MCZ9306534.1 metal ABC transporter permease [Corynebacterium curieae]